LKVREVLEAKGSKVVTIEADATLRSALSRICEDRVGGLLVLNRAGKLDGIITERDIMRQVHQRADLEQVKVADVMTKTVKVASPDADIEEVEYAMTEGRFRHMPVLDGDEIVGVISIGDMVKANLREVKSHMEHLIDYLAVPLVD
jgi:CBS domain-containing protein